MLSYILYGLCWLMGCLPLRVLYLLSDVIYLLVYYLIHYRRKVVRTNLCNAFPEKGMQEIIQIEREFYKHLVDTSVELYKAWHFSEKTIRKRMVFTNPELAHHYFSEGRGVIAVMGHYNNWEWLSSTYLWLKGADAIMLYKPLHNAALDRMTLNIRSRFGCKPIPKDRVLRELNHYIAEKRPYLVCFIGDQTPNVHNLHFWMPFLNQDTPVLLGTEKIARKYDIPVVFLHIGKVKRGYYEVEFVKLCDNPSSLAPGELTEMHTRMLESYIREKPAYWLWSHRRWKHERVKSEE